MPSRASIRAYLLRLVLVVALPLVALVAWNLYDSAQADSQYARQQVLHLAQVTASETAKFLGQTRNILSGLAARPAVKALDPSRCDPILKVLLALAPRFANAVTMAADATVVCSAVPLGGPSRGNPDRFIKLLRGPDQLTVGKAAPGVITGRWVVPVGWPLLDAQGGIVGAVILPVDLLTLPVLPSLEGLPADAVVGLIEADGTVLARSIEAERYIGTKADAGRTAQREESGTAEMTGLDGIARIQGFVPVPGTNWIAIASVPASAVYAGARARIRTSALLGIVVVSLALLLASHLSRQIHGPIAAIANAADEVAAGNLAARAPVAGSAETAEFPTQFNRMLDSRARGEEALRESEERHRDLVENIRDLICTHDLAGNILFANRASAELLGYTPDELLKINLRDIVAPAVRAEFEAYLAAIQRDGAASGLMRVRTKAGETRIWEYRNTLRADGAGAPTVRGLARDISERKRAEEALRESKARLEALTRRLLEVQETERRSIARELHDEVGGVLTAVKLNLQSLRRPRTGDAAEAALADGLALVDGAIHSVRSLSLDLRPAVLDDLGLIPALKSYCERQAQRAGIPIELALDAIDVKPAPQLESACFRIVQESVTNALRHANARRIQIALHRVDASFSLEIADDGDGFDVAAARKRGFAGASIGLLGMEERANLLGGRLSIDSAPGAGVRVRVEFSMPEEGSS